MNANVSKLLNEQINKEFYSAYLYLDFANYYASVGLDGFENWYRVQAQEERDHAMLFYQYLQNNSEGVTFEAIAKPEWERGDHMTPLKKALAHEKLVTASIDAIYAAAYEARDFRAMQMPIAAFLSSLSVIHIAALIISPANSSISAFNSEFGL